MSKRIATLPQIMAMNKLLAENLVIVEPATDSARAIVEYKNDMTDGRVAQSVHPDLTASHVRRVRSDLFGLLREAAMRTAASEKDSDNIVGQQLLELQRQLSNTRSDLDLTKKDLAELQSKFNKLAFALNQKGYADAKHLLVKQSDGSVPGLVTKGGAG